MAGVVSAIFLASFIIFLVLMFFYAFFATFKMKRKRDLTYEEFLVGGRKIGLTVTSLSLAVSYLGSGTVSGIVEIIYTAGFVWAQALICIPVSLLIAGLLFARRMRQAGHMTVLDPFKEQYGDVIPMILFIVCALLDIFSSAALLASISASISVVMDLNPTMVTILTALFVCLYTSYGGLYAVAYSGIIQLVLSQVLWIPAGFAYNNEAVISTGRTGMWHLDPLDIALWIDYAIALVLGGTTSQVFFQRVLSCKSAGYSQVASVLACLACLVIMVPAAFMGYIVSNTDWNSTEFGGHLESPDYRMSLAYSFLYLCPTSVGVMGVFAIAAILMSAIDANFLSTASLFVHHVYLPIRSKLCRNHQPSDTESLWVARIAVFIFAAMTVAISVTMPTIYGFWYLISDLNFIIVFPQLICALFIPFSNVWGSLAGLFVGLLFRVLSGEPLLHLPAAIKYPGYHYETALQRFPHRTFTMILSFVVMISVSLLAKLIITRRARPEMSTENKKGTWFGSEGDYKPKKENNDTLPDKSDTAL